MVDLMSGGRLVFGVGSGYLAHEFAGYGVDPKEKRERFNAALDTVKRLMAGETVGKAVLNVRPHEGRVPPMYVAILAREGAYHVGKQGDRIFTVPYASCKDFADIGTMLAEFRRGRSQAGLGEDDDDHVFTLHTYVSDTDASAKAEAKQAYDLYVDTRLYAKKHIYEDIIANGICLFGSVDTVTRKILQLHAMGIRHVATMHNFGALDPALVQRSMVLFARSVMPQVRSTITGA
jgi:alkanesulfonate monooxygenase SsuD/methylene tetrahydromethanopterin reductase-like flavin-dependent oxidoreductase (luciferase family)